MSDCCPVWCSSAEQPVIQIMLLHTSMVSTNKIIFLRLYQDSKSFVFLIWDTRQNELYGDQNGKTFACSELLLSSDGRSCKLHLLMWVRGQRRKRYSSDISILLSTNKCPYECISGMVAPLVLYSAWLPLCYTQPGSPCVILSLAPLVLYSAWLPLCYTQPGSPCVILSLAPLVLYSAWLPLCYTQPGSPCVILSLAPLVLYSAWLPLCYTQPFLFSGSFGHFQPGV